MSSLPVAIPDTRRALTAQPWGARRLSFWHDRFALFLFVCLFAMQAIAIELGAFSGLMLKLRWGILGLMAFVGIFALPRLARAGISAEHRWLVALALLGLISCGYSIDPWYSFQRWASLVMLLVALFVGAWVWLQREDRIYVAVNLLFVLIAFVSLVAVFHTGAGEIINRDERATGAFDKATGAGHFAALSLPIILWKLRYSTGWARRVAIGTLLIQAYLLFFSGARGALGATVMVLPVIVWFQYPRLRGHVILAAMVLMIAIGGGVLGMQVLPEYVVRRDTISNLTGRAERFEALVVAWQKQPALGYGYGVGRLMIVHDADALEVYLGNETSRISNYYRKAHANGTQVEIHTHSDHLERLVEGGIVGYLPFMAFCLVLLSRVPRALRRPIDPLNDLCRLLVVAIWVWFVDSFLHSGTFAVGNGPTTLVWFILLLWIAADTVARRRGSVRSHPLSRADQADQPDEYSDLVTTHA